MRGKILRHLAINTGPNYASEVSSIVASSRARQEGGATDAALLARPAR